MTDRTRFLTTILFLTSLFLFCEWAGEWVGDGKGYIP